jgi:bifunctional non-homologous end joining protein LigD
MAFAPVLAASAPAVPIGAGFAFEPKWDGFRTLVKIDATGRCRLVSRHGRIWTDAFPELSHIGRTVTGPAVLDGETIVMGEDGRPSFERLSARLARGRGPRRPATFVAFDVLQHEGQVLVDRPWTERRQLLAGLELDGERAVATMVCQDGDALFAATAHSECCPRR